MPNRSAAPPLTAPRAQNRRTWFYRIAPSVLAQSAYRRIDLPFWLTAPSASGIFPHFQCRWSPQPVPAAPADFLDGMATYVWNGDMGAGAGLAVHLYRANASMERRFFKNADAEMVLLPETGAMRLRTECGTLDLAPGDFAVVPRGIKIAVDLPDGPSRGYVCENYGAPFELPELGPIGSNGLANPRDFLYPQAAYEDVEGDFELVLKAGGAFMPAISPIRRSTLPPGTVPTRPANTTCASSTCSGRSASTIRTRRSSRC